MRPCTRRIVPAENVIKATSLNDVLGEHAPWCRTAPNAPLTHTSLQMTGKRPRCKVTAMSQPTADLIRGVPLFADLDDKTVERLAGEFIERHFDEGAAIATEGTDGLNFFIVASGEAAVTIHGEQVGTLGPGTAFGEVALVDKSARSATVTATTPMIAYALPVWSFRPFVEQRPELAWKLLEVLAERLRAANAR